MLPNTNIPAPIACAQIGVLRQPRCNCPFFDGWHDQLQVRIAHLLTSPVVGRHCPKNNCFADSARTIFQTSAQPPRGSFETIQKNDPARLEFAIAGPAPCGVLRLNGTEVPRAIKEYVRSGSWKVNGQSRARATRSPAGA